MHPIDLTQPKVVRSPFWPGVRRAHLAGEPRCACCGTDEFVEVHHVKPVHAAPELELEPANLITLCASPSHNCHLWVGHLGSWRSWNTTVRRDAARMLARIRTRPGGTAESLGSSVEGQAGGASGEERGSSGQDSLPAPRSSPLVICFGINNYRGTANDLAKCVADAEALARLFGGRTILDAAVTRTRFREELADWAAAVPAWRGPSDYGVATYSGHGTYVPDQNGDEPDGRDECLVMASLSLVRDDEFRQLLAGRRPGARLVVISDCCFSGTNYRSLQDVRDPVRVRYLPPIHVGLVGRGLRQRPTPRPAPLEGVVHLAASSDFEYSYEGESRGVFTGALEAAYRPELTIGAWFAAAQKIVRASGYPQTPQINCPASALDWPVPRTRAS